MYEVEVKMTHGWMPHQTGVTFETLAEAVTLAAAISSTSAVFGSPIQARVIEVTRTEIARTVVHPSA